jgi:hypothetical protein
MRLLIIGTLGGQIGAATKIALDKGAKVAHASGIEQALSELRGGRGADLIMCDVALDIGTLVRSLAAEHICTPVIACGIAPMHGALSMRFRAGAKGIRSPAARSGADRRGVGSGRRRIPPADFRG